jgi:diamine N-acetyltransferase
MHFSISPIQITDLAELQEMSIRTFKDAFAALNTEENMNSYLSKAFNENQLRNDILNPSSQFFFCLFNKTPIGYMKVNFAPAQTDLNDPESLELERIYIAKEFQNLKGGHFLLEEAVKLAVQHGLKYMWLGVWDQNAKAIRFYENHGFVRSGEHPFMLGTDRQIDIILRRPL